MLVCSGNVIFLKINQHAVASISCYGRGYTWFVSAGTLKIICPKNAMRNLINVADLKKLKQKAKRFLIEKLKQNSSKNKAA